MEKLQIRIQLFADECAARRIFDEVLLCQRNVKTRQTQRWAGSNATFATPKIEIRFDPFIWFYRFPFRLP